MGILCVPSFFPERGLCHRRANPIRFISEGEKVFLFISLFPPPPLFRGSAATNTALCCAPLPTPRPAAAGLRGNTHTHTDTGDPRTRRGSAPAPHSRSPALPPALPALQAAAGGRVCVYVCVGGGDGHPQQRGRLPSPAAPAPPHHRSGAQRKRTRRSIHPPHLKPSRFPRAVAAGSGPSVT